MPGEDLAWISLIGRGVVDAIGGHHKEPVLFDVVADALVAR